MFVFVFVLLSSHFAFGPLRDGWVDDCSVMRGGGVSCRVGPRPRLHVVGIPVIGARHKVQALLVSWGIGQPRP